MIELVVTRHPALVEYLREIGLVIGQVEVHEHVTPQMVLGRHVCGVFQHSLSCLREIFTEIPLDLPQELRGAELTLDQVRNKDERFARKADPFTSFYGEKEDKYRDILSTPEQANLSISGKDSALLEKIDTREAKPQDIDAHLSGIKDSAEKERTTEALKSIIADQIGDMLETYRYESAEEGQAIENYIDSLLRVVRRHEVSAGKPLQGKRGAPQKIAGKPGPEEVPNSKRLTATQETRFSAIDYKDTEVSGVIASPGKRTVVVLRDELKRALAVMMTFNVPLGERDHVESAIKAAEGTL